MNYTGYKKGIYLKPHAIKKNVKALLLETFFYFCDKKILASKI